VAVITILGAGVMGSAMCLPARARGHEVRLVGTYLDTAIIESLRATGRHPRLAAKLPEGVQVFTHDQFAQALGDDTDLILLGVSSAGVGWAIDRLCETLRKPIDVVMITKGLIPIHGSLHALPDHVATEVKQRADLALNIAAVGGPCIAGELAVARHTGVVITAHDTALAERLSSMLATDFYHPRPSHDLMGVEVCAAFKNFFAIAVGWAAGRREIFSPVDNGALNHNAAAVLFDQAVAEMMVLVRHLGGEDASVWGMPGAGDLYVTCQAGRNSRLGRQLGLGLTYAEVKAGPMKDDTIEGAELGIAVAATLEQMMQAQQLDRAALPVTTALLAALTRNTPLDIPWDRLHRYH